MRGTYGLRKARKEYRCTEASYHTIRAGDVYLHGACPPEHEANMGRKWWIIRACLRCADHFGLHTSDTRKQLEELSRGNGTAAMRSVPLPEPDASIVGVPDVHPA